MFVPPTIAESMTPFRSAVKAESIAVIELLQEVSNTIDGPSRPRVKEIRLASNAWEFLLILIES